MCITYFFNKSLYIKLSVSCLLYLFSTSPCTFNYQCHVYYIFYPTGPCTFNYQCHVYYIFFQQVPVHSTISVMFIIYISNKSLYIKLSVSCLLYLFPISPCTFNYQCHVYYIFFQQVPVHSTISVMFIIYFSNKSLYIQLSVSCLLYIFPTSPCTLNYQCHVYYIFFQ